MHSVTVYTSVRSHKVPLQGKEIVQQTCWQQIFITRHLLATISKNHRNRLKELRIEFSHWKEHPPTRFVFIVENDCIGNDNENHIEIFPNQT